MSVPTTSDFSVNNHVEKGLPTSTTTTRQIPNHNPNQKHNPKHNRHKALGAQPFNYNNQRGEENNC
jgi:hypothetical protein